MMKDDFESVCKFMSDHDPSEKPELFKHKCNHKFVNNWSVYCDKYTDRIIKGVDTEYIYSKIDEYIEDIGPYIEQGISCTSLTIQNRYVVSTHYANFGRSVKIESVYDYRHPRTVVAKTMLERWNASFPTEGSSMKLTMHNLRKLREPFTETVDEIDDERCFDGESIESMMQAFNFMLRNFEWCEFNCIIQDHSLFGQAFYNSFLRCNVRNDSLISRDDIKLDIAMEEFKKLLTKYKYKGYPISYSIRKRYGI